LKIPSARIRFGTTPSTQGIGASPDNRVITANIPGTEVDQDQAQETFVTAMQSRMDEELKHTQRLMDSPSGFEDDIVESLFNPEENA